IDRFAKAFSDSRRVAKKLHVDGALRLGVLHALTLRCENGPQRSRSNGPAALGPFDLFSYVTRTCTYPHTGQTKARAASHGRPRRIPRQAVSHATAGRADASRRPSQQVRRRQAAWGLRSPEGGVKAALAEACTPGRGPRPRRAG